MKEPTLNEMECRIIELVAVGYLNKEIAEKLHISTHSVKAYLAVLFKKFDSVNRSHLVYNAFRYSLIPDNLKR